MPKNVTANTGIDVFFHAYEAYVSTIANDFTDIFAVRLDGARCGEFEKCLDDPQDIEARSAMSFANTIAGRHQYFGHAHHSRYGPQHQRAL